MLKRLSKAKFVVLYLSLVLVTVNCVQDDKIFHMQEQEEPLDLHLDKTIITVDAKDIPNLIQEVADQHKGFLPKLEPTSTTKNNGTSNSFGEIDTSIIKALEDLEGNRTYTFKIHPYQKEDNIFYNFIMVTDDEATIERMYILKYTSDDGKSYGKDFNGTVEKYELDGTYKKGTYFQDGQGDGEDCMDCTEPPEDGDSEDDDSDTDANTAAQDNDGDNQSSGSSGSSSSSSNSSGPSSGPGDGGGGQATPIFDYTMSYYWTCNAWGEQHSEISGCCCADEGGVFTYFITKTASQNPPPDFVPCCDDDDVVVMDDENPCEELEKLLDNNDVEQAVEFLQQALGGMQEEGYEISEVQGDSLSLNSLDGGGTLNLMTGANITGHMHIHNMFGTKFYSGNDLRKLFDLYRDLEISPKSPEDVYSVFINEYGVYAIKINSFGALSRLVYEVGYKKIDQRFQGFYNSITVQDSNNKFEGGFLKGLKELSNNLSLGVDPVSLFKKNINSNVFEKVVLHENGNPVTKPCN